MSIMKTIKFPGDTESREIYDEQARNAIGDLESLNTTDKTSLVNAINEVANYSYEEWVFTLDDDTTVTKKVVVIK